MSKVFRTYVERGRIAVIKSGPYAKHPVVITDIVDHNRALIHGPCTGVPRETVTFSRLILTDMKIPRAYKTSIIKKHWEDEKITERWNESPLGKLCRAKRIRATVNDYDRHKLMKAKQIRNRIIRKAFKRAKRVLKERKRFAVVKNKFEKMNKKRVAAGKPPLQKNLRMRRSKFSKFMERVKRKKLAEKKKALRLKAQQLKKAEKEGKPLEETVPETKVVPKQQQKKKAKPIPSELKAFRHLLKKQKRELKTLQRKKQRLLAQKMTELRERREAAEASGADKTSMTPEELNAADRRTAASILKWNDIKKRYYAGELLTRQESKRMSYNLKKVAQRRSAKEADKKKAAKAVAAETAETTKKE